jgi:DNA-binding response OmpR family regulator
MQQKKVLLIDDNELIGQLVAEILADQPLHVFTTVDVREGLRIAMTEKPDLLLLDIDMPEVNGLDLLKQIRSMQTTQDLPVVMLTANERLSSIQRATELGVLGYILKPFKHAYLIERLAYFLGLSSEAMNAEKENQQPLAKQVVAKARAVKTKNLLLIDDEPLFGDLVAAMLEDTIFAVHIMTDPREGLRWAMTQPVDLIMLDLNLPEMDGFEIGQQLKKMRATQNIPILVISGYLSPEVERDVLAMGAADFLGKPFTPLQLIQALTQLTGKPVYWEL